MTTPNPFRYHAYLCLYVQFNNTPFPVAVGAKIFSEPAQQLTVQPSKGVYVQVMEATGSSFQEAEELLLNAVKRTHMWDTLKVWLDDSLEGHNERYRLQEGVRPQIQHAIQEAWSRCN